MVSLCLTAIVNMFVMILKINIQKCSNASNLSLLWGQTSSYNGWMDISNFELFANFSSFFQSPENIYQFSFMILKYQERLPRT